MNEEFEQNYYSRTAEGKNRIGHDSMKLVNWMVQYDKFYENWQFL